MSGITQSKDTFVFTTSSLTAHDLTLKQNTGDAVSLPISISDVSTLQTELNNKLDDSQLNDAVTTLTDVWSSTKINTELTGKSDTGHVHSISDITSLQTTLDTKVAQNLTTGIIYTSSGGSQVGLSAGASGSVLTSNGIGFPLSYQAIPSQIDDVTPALTTAYSSTKSNNTFATVSHSHAATSIGNGDVTDAELSYINSVTSNVQDQIDGKQASLTAPINSVTFQNIVPGITTDKLYMESDVLKFEGAAIIDTTSGALAYAPLSHSHAATSIGNGDVTDAELSYINSVTSNVQDQIDGKIDKTLVTTEGDIIYRNATIPTRLARGTNGQVLTATASTVSWATPAVTHPSVGLANNINVSNGAGDWVANSNFNIVSNNVFTFTNQQGNQITCSDLIMDQSDDNAILMNANGGIQGVSNVKFGGTPASVVDVLYSNAGKLTYAQKEIIRADTTLVVNGYVPYYQAGTNLLAGSVNLTFNGAQLSTASFNATSDASINSVAIQAGRHRFTMSACFQNAFQPATGTPTYASWGAGFGSTGMSYIRIPRNGRIHSYTASYCDNNLLTIAAGRSVDFKIGKVINQDTSPIFTVIPLSTMTWPDTLDQTRPSTQLDFSGDGVVVTAGDLISLSCVEVGGLISDSGSEVNVTILMSYD